MKEVIVKEKIKDMIYVVRGKEVMLDSDLARLYGCKNGTKTINLAVKRNIERFPSDFYFEIDADEFPNKFLRFQFETSKKMRGGRQYKLHVFTQEGIAMLSSVIRTSVAAQINIKIMREFVSMKKLLLQNSNIYEKIINLESDINSKFVEQDLRINELFSKFDNKEFKQTIFFEGQIYDAYSLMMGLLEKAKKEIIIIDNYAGRELFDLLKDVKVPIKIYSKNINSELIKRYNEQYKNIKCYNNESFHDRFIIIDEKQLYSCGMSFKDLAKKCMGIYLVEDKKYLTMILNELGDSK